MPEVKCQFCGGGGRATVSYDRGHVCPECESCLMDDEHAPLNQPPTVNEGPTAMTDERLDSLRRWTEEGTRLLCVEVSELIAEVDRLRSERRELAGRIEASGMLLADAHAKELDQTPLTAEFVSGCKLDRRQYEIHRPGETTWSLYDVGADGVAAMLKTCGQLRTACRLFSVTLKEGQQ